MCVKASEWILLAMLCRCIGFPLVFGGYCIYKSRHEEMSLRLILDCEQTLEVAWGTLWHTSLSERMRFKPQRCWILNSDFDNSFSIAVALNVILTEWPITGYSNENFSGTCIIYDQQII